MTVLQEYAEDLDLLDDRERFIYLIELGQTLPKYPTNLQTSEYEVPGCTSLVYIHASRTEGKVHYDVHAQAKVVRGYLRILLDALQDKSAEQILNDTSVDEFITKAGLNVTTQHSRANAFGNMYAFMKQQAKQFKE